MKIDTFALPGCSRRLLVCAEAAPLTVVAVPEAVGLQVVVHLQRPAEDPVPTLLRLLGAAVEHAQKVKLLARRCFWLLVLLRLLLLLLLLLFFLLLKWGVDSLHFYI